MPFLQRRITAGCVFLCHFTTDKAAYSDCNERNDPNHVFLPGSAHATTAPYTYAMARDTQFRHRLKRDALVIAISITLAIYASKSGALDTIFLVSPESEFIGAFIAGLLFTSLFTTPLAIAMFAAIAPEVNILFMALLGACGSVLGDLALFGLIRHTFRDDLEHLLSLRKIHRLTAVFHRRVFRWILPFIGALIIASPFPDELGIGLMGVSRMKLSTLIIVSYVMNAIGIFLIGLAAVSAV